MTFYKNIAIHLLIKFPKIHKKKSEMFEFKIQYNVISVIV